MKKSFVILLSAIMLITSFLPIVASANTSFPDLSDSHWAYSYIMQLVSDGTIKGYENGHFMPDNKVTRAEFVKMLGQGSTVRNSDYKDVSSSHWGYDYIMSSGLEADSYGNFNPSVPIKRETVIELLWQRNGMAKGIFAPFIITNQAENKDAIAWAYSYSLMQGDDGVNLRLSDGIKRSEAAALIVRARNIDASSQKKDFKDIVKPEILKVYYDSLSLFEGEYTPSKAVTNGEMARAALIIGCEETVPSYQGLTLGAAFEHKYAVDLYLLGRYAIGEDKITPQFADATATYGDTVAFLSYNYIRKSSKGIDLSHKSDDLSSKVSDTANSLITFAKRYGIWDYSANDLNAPISQKDFMALIVLFDALIGTESDIITEYHAFWGDNISADHSLALIAEPVNPDFKLILSDMPSSVDSTEFESFGNETALPKDAYAFAKNYSIVFIGMLNSYKDAVKLHSGAEVKFTFYPSLCYKNGNGYTLRVKCDVISNGNAKTVGTLFPKVNSQIAETEIQSGDSFYLDLASGAQITSMDVPADTVYVSKIIR